MSQAWQVDEIPLPPSMSALSRLARADYTDAFALATARAGDRTAEEWARAMLEDAPGSTRGALRRGWRALGLRLGPTADCDRVLGWPVRDRAPEHAVLTGDSLLGMRAELVFARERDTVLMATVLTLRHPLARAVWAFVAPRHRRIVRHLLEQAGRRAADGTVSASG